MSKKCLLAYFAATVSMSTTLRKDNLVIDYESIDKPIDEALKAEAYWLYQATSKTPAIKRFTIADEKDMQRDMNNQRNWNGLVEGVQEIQ